MKKENSSRGFTIVELLIVIVVIGILAAITIVSFNGVTTKANFTAAKSLGSSVSKKASIFHASYGRYPSVVELQNNRAADSAVDNSGPVEAKLPSGVVLAYANASTGKTTVYYAPYCTGATGAFIDYWDYGNNRITSGSSTPQSYILGNALTC